MRFEAKGLRGAWLAAFLSVASLAAAAGDRRLVEAVEKRDKEAVRSLLKQHADVNATQADGATALAWAAHWDDLETADLLIRAGAHVNAANDYGVTPLSLACTNGSAAMVEKLLRAGANPNAVQLEGETPLMTCARTGNAAAVKLLIAHEARVNAQETWRGQTALMWAVAERHPEVVQALIDRGAEVDARSKGGFTPLLFAAQQGDVDAAGILLAAGANVNEAAPNGMTPLLVASSSGQGVLSAFLLDKGADPNAADGRGYTALHYAAAGRNLLELAKALLAHGANPNPRLVKGDAGATPFYLAAAAGNVNVMRALAAGGADPLIPTTDNTNALMVAAGVGRFESRTDAQNRSALEAVKLAAELGSDVNAAGENQWTALHGAAYTGSDAILQFLVEKGARMDVMDAFGQTPLSIAEAVVTKGLGENADVRPRRWRDSTVNLLLKLGATPLEASGVERVGSMAVVPVKDDPEAK
jgi:ankyrin repeat protein